jgi:hypothetical protein
MEGSKATLKVFVRATADIEAHPCLEASMSTVIASVNSRCRIEFNTIRKDRTIKWRTCILVSFVCMGVSDLEDMLSTWLS